MRQSLSEKSIGVPPLLWAGLAATALITVYALVDPSTSRLLAAQIEAGYPSYGPDEVGAGVTVYVAILATVGILGIIGWVTTILVARARRRAALWIGAAFCAIGLLIALSGLTITDTSGIVGLAPVFGWLLLVPCVIGVAALISMGRKG